MSVKNRGLGKGLGALIGSAPRVEELRRPVGYINKQIAGELNIAEITVKKCLSNIYARLGIPNRASLIKKLIT